MIDFEIEVRATDMTNEIIEMIITRLHQREIINFRLQDVGWFYEITFIADRPQVLEICFDTTTPGEFFSYAVDFIGLKSFLKKVQECGDWWDAFESKILGEYEEM